VSGRGKQGGEQEERSRKAPLKGGRGERKEGRKGIEGSIRGNESDFKWEVEAALSALFGYTCTGSAVHRTTHNGQCRLQFALGNSVTFAAAASVTMAVILDLRITLLRLILI
jgi:hypothetical protein